MIKLIKFQE